MPKLTHRQHVEVPPADLLGQRALVAGCTCEICVKFGASETPFIYVEDRPLDGEGLDGLYERLPGLMGAFRNAFFCALADGTPEIGIEIPAFKFLVRFDSDGLLSKMYDEADSMTCPCCGELYPPNMRREIFEALMNPDTDHHVEQAHRWRESWFEVIIEVAMEHITVHGPCQDCRRPRWPCLAKFPRRGGRPPVRCPECQAKRRKKQVRKNVRAHRERKA